MYMYTHNSTKGGALTIANSLLHLRRNAQYTKKGCNEEIEFGLSSFTVKTFEASEPL